MTDQTPQRTWRDVDLSKYNNTWWHPGRGMLTISLWRWFGLWLLKHLPCETIGERFFNGLKVWLLRRFGAEIGAGAVVRSCEIYYPWNLRMGDNVWIGYDAYLYNIVPIRLGDNTCVSQRAFLCTGSHDPAEPTFGLIVGEIELKDAAWVAAGVFVGPGVTLHEGAVAGAGSVVTKDLPSMTLCGGVPARPIKPRVIVDKPPNEPRRAPKRMAE
jgi:putative colanic acid biosynthesis acetyltransferase WcaF